MRRYASVIFVMASFSLLLAVPSAPAAEKCAPDDTACLTISAPPQPRRQIAAGHSVTVLRQDELTARGAVTLGDALEFMPGVSFARAGGIGTVSTLRMRGTQSGQLLVLLDGLPIQDAGSVENNFDFNRLLLQDIERIELVRGSNAVRFGSGAMSGVLNIITKRADKKGISVELHGEYGSYGSARVTAALGYRKDAWRARVASSHYASEGFSRTLAGPEKDATALSDVRLTLETRLARAHRLELGAHVGVHRVEYDPSATEDGDAVANGQHYSLRGVWDWQPSPALQSRLNLGYVHDSREDESAGAFPFTASNEGERLHLHYQLDWRAWEPLLISAGASAQRETWSDDTGQGAGSTAPAAENVAIEGGAFAEAVYEPHRLVQVSAGVRASGHETYGFLLAWQTGAQARLPATNTALRATYGRGFKSPSLYQLYAPPSFGFAVGNPDLQAEQSDHFDIGITHTFMDDGIEIDINYFFLRVHDQIAFETAGYVNRTRVRSEGTEISVSLHPTPALAFGLHYTYTAAHDEDTRAPSLRVPAHALNFDASWRGRAWELGTNVRYVSERWDISNATFARALAPAYVVWDFNGGYHLNERVAFTWRVENILDRQYQEILDYRTSGRGFYVGVQVRS